MRKNPRLDLKNKELSFWIALALTYEDALSNLAHLGILPVNTTTAPAIRMLKTRGRVE